jgi:hypothetical protein
MAAAISASALADWQLRRVRDGGYSLAAGFDPGLRLLQFRGSLAQGMLACRGVAQPGGTIDAAA